MVRKSEIDKLAEDLDGRDIAFLTIQRAEDLDHDRQPAYSEEELNRMKKKSKGDPEKEFNKFQKWMDIYQALRYYVENAKILNLQARNKFNGLQSMYSKILTDQVISINKQKLPVPMTKKEYEDKKELQKELELNKYHCIDEVISKRASRLFREEKDELPSHDKYFAEFIRENYPEYYKRAKKQVKEMIDDGVVNPVERGTLEEWISKNKTDKELEEYNEKFKMLAKNMEFEKLNRLEQKFFENISAWPGEEDLQDSSEKAVWLYQTYIKAEELYQLDLPEWTEWIDEYRPGWYEFQEDEAGWSWAGEIAIVQNPQPQNLDDNGWYKKDDLFSDVVGRKRVEAHLLEQCKEDGITVEELIETNHNQAVSLIEKYKSTVDLLEVFSDIIGQVDLTEDLAEYEENLKKTVQDYNNKINLVERWYLFGKDGETYEVDLQNFILDYDEIPIDEDFSAELDEVFDPLLVDNWREKSPEEVRLDV